MKKVFVVFFGVCAFLWMGMFADAVTFTMTGPKVSERGDANPFLDYRLDVTFTKGDTSITVPGYFAADGNAANSGAESGNIWRVQFFPPEMGTWTYTISFLSGPGVAVMDNPSAGTPLMGHGFTTSIEVSEDELEGPGFLDKGILEYVGERYLRFSRTGEYFLKGGADSPENFLGYADFDQTPSTHRYEPHANDWRTGDPTWRGGKGKNIIGALNYLSGKGMNSVYFLTMNVDGDGKDVWPWVAEREFLRYDCSKLDQWEIVFSHMDSLGLMLHIVTQETENDQLLDGGELGTQRKLYYRELIARFAHHPALVWNLGEENTNTDEQRMAFARYIRTLDPYEHPIVVHTPPGKYDEVYTPLLGFEYFEGPSLQIGRNQGVRSVHDTTLTWVKRSEEAGRPWFVCLDEIGPARIGVKPDADDPDHDEMRVYALWGNMMAGGAGCEWYFGYAFAHNDLNCEDWRSRERMWDLTRYALEFFRESLPFSEMTPADQLVSIGWCLAKPGEVYAVYLPEGGTAELQIEEGVYDVSWYNPRNGGELLKGTVARVEGPGKISLGLPPSEPEKDWAVRVKN